MYNYPHFYGEEKRLLDTFWQETSFDFNSVAYDVPVLGFFDYDKQDFKSINENWEYLASLKVDMVGFTNDYTYIFEFKHVSKPEGLGQLLLYRHLCLKHKLFIKPFKLYFVSFLIRPVLKEVLKEHGIESIELERKISNILF